ncbi:hypothetical protein Ahy_B06g086015 isoform C [Arachis hypogaea]|uniref:Uncharacterized protein n=1 Tax=Arachis hypogaea TaxID=3818 RepID=A0A444YWE1_ARAHY|nr:hypothetical protein Ahy_B06g086015 isoform C [Arachis hypogaea]
MFIQLIAENIPHSLETNLDEADSGDGETAPQQRRRRRDGKVAPQQRRRRRDDDDERRGATNPTYSDTL